MRFKLLILIAALAASSGGCASTPSVAAHTTLSRDEIAQIQKEQAARLLGEQKVTAGQELRQAGIFAPFVVVAVVWDALIDRPIAAGFEKFSGDTPAHAALNMVKPDSPDENREGIYRLAQFMQQTGVREAYINYMVIVADTHADYTVRAAALRVLNEFRIKAAVPVAIKDMDNANKELVRLEAAKLLANIPDSSAVPTLILHLQSDDSSYVRIACADGLRNFNRVEVTDALTSVLGGTDFSVAYVAHQSLRVVTYHDFQYDKSQWQAYLTPSLRSTP